VVRRRPQQEPIVSLPSDSKLDPGCVARLFAEHGDELRVFLRGVLGDGDSAEEVLQASFAKAAEQGHRAQPESLRAWLFSVAYHEAMAVVRRQGVHARAKQQLARQPPPTDELPEQRLVRLESIERVRKALEELPVAQREVVVRRFYHQQKFASIAEELNLPLGTVLTRMRAALARLRKALAGEDPKSHRES
jgi:RNA polymerase sigma factor (sigma-70 family)